MLGRVDIPHGRYVDVRYRMFNLSSRARIFMKTAGLISLPIIYPLVLIAKLSPETGFRTVSELLSLMPFAMGVIIRYEFYKRTLRACGDNVFIMFGTVFYYPQVSIGNNVLIGMYNTIHHCDFGNNVLVAEGCRFTSGSKQYGYARLDIPISQQHGKMTRIRVGHDVWVGTNSIIMADIGTGSVVGAGSVVTDRVEPSSIVGGNPARILRMRQVNEGD
jgi:virginiamycin A acetyltransferase